MDSTELLEQLIKTGTPARLVAQVATLVAEVDSLQKRRKADAARKRMSRDIRGSPSSHVTSRMSQDVTPSIYTTPPKNSEPKRVPRSMPKHELPPDFELSEGNRGYARKQGWAETKIDSEFERFRDHALASGRKQVDWNAAWRKWVTSPYQKLNGGMNGTPTANDCAAVARKIVNQISGDASGDSDWMLPEVGRGRP